MADYERKQGVEAYSASDETLRLYLLCRLGEKERLSLDERLMIDDELAGRMLLAESELTDAYASGELDTVERGFFEKHFLSTEARRQNLRFSSALREFAGSQSASTLASPIVKQEESTWREGLGGLFGFGRPRAWAMAGSFAVLILFVGLAWFMVRQPRDRAPVVARNEPIPTGSLQASPAADASPEALIPPETQPPQRKPNGIPTPPAASAPVTVASFVLLPGVVRDGGDMVRVAVPKGERDIVRLSLVVEAVAEGPYRAEVSTAEGQKVMVRNKLKMDSRKGDPKLTIDIPARLLQRGDYQIKLSRQKADGQREALGRYYFRALD